MATTRYVIQINTTGAVQAQQQIAAIGTASKQTNSAVQFLQQGLRTIGGALAARQLALYADSVTNLKNRLTLLTDSTNEVKAITDELFDIAARTRTEFDSTAQIYTRLALAGKTLGESQSELLKVTESINQAVILSGANAREASNGLIQLSQAIASNRLGGDELRSVLEQLPAVADIVGKELVRVGLATRGTRGEVRQLGFEGKITARILIDAFKQARQELAEKFAKTVPTIGQAFEVLRTRFVQFINDTNEATGGSRVLARAIIFVAEHLGDFADALTVLAGAFAGLKLASLIGLVVDFGRALFAVGAIATASGAQVVTFTGFVTSLRVALVGLTASLPVVGIALAALGAGFAYAYSQGNILRKSTKELTDDALKELGDALTEASDKTSKLTADQRDALGQLEGQIRSTVQFLQDADKKLIVTNPEQVDAATRALGKLVQELKALGRAAADPELTKLQKEQQELIDKLRRGLEQEAAALKLPNRERKVAIDLLRIEEQLRAKQIGGKQLEALLAEFNATLHFNQALQDQADILDEINGPLENFVATLDALQGLLPQIGWEEYNRRVDEAMLKSLEAGRTFDVGLERALIRNKLAVQDVASITEEYATQVLGTTHAAQNLAIQEQVLGELYAKNAITLERYNELMIQAQLDALELDRTLSGGLSRGILKVQQEMMDVASVAESAVVNSFHNAESALTNFIMTGKLGFKELEDQILKDFTQVALRQLERSLLNLAAAQGGGGGILGSLFGGNANAPGSATTQTVQVPQFARGGEFMVGGSPGTDRNLVAFHASRGERVSVTPAGASSRAAAPTNIVFNIQTPDVEGFQRSQGQILTRAQASLDRAQRRNA